MKRQIAEVYGNLTINYNYYGVFPRRFFLPETMFQVVHGNVTINHNYFPDPPTESETSPITVKFKESMKEELGRFCFERGISRSAFLRDAAKFYRRIYANKDKLLRYQDAVEALLERLP